MSASKLSQTALLAAVLAAAGAAQAADEGKPATPKEKCYGVSKAGENACASANGSHTCAAQSKTAYDGQEFKDVPKGTCVLMNGSLTPFEGANPKMKS
jgi:uncharacterized membrane protein